MRLQFPYGACDRRWGQLRAAVLGSFLAQTTHYASLRMPHGPGFKTAAVNPWRKTIVERPHGTRIRFRACPSPVFSATGDLVGAVNMLIDLTKQAAADGVTLRHNAIVESSDDTIVAKNLNGIITN